MSRYTVILALILTISALLRIWRLNAIPPGLHGDELGAVYNAYALITTGKDEYGIQFPFTFRNDFSPLIFYASIPLTWLLGLNEWAVRLPSVLVGTFMIFVFYLLIKTLSNNYKLALLGALCMSISSWHIRSSRLGLEMIWSLLFQLLGVFFFTRKTKQSRKNIFLSFIFFGLSVLSYQSAKMTTPLLIVLLCFIYRDRYRKYFLPIGLLFSACIVLPISIYFIVRPFNQMRFVGISVFTVWKSTYPSGAKLITPPALFDLAGKIIGNYFKHFDPHILFIDNSRLRYYQLDNIGLLSFWQIPFIFIGALSLLKQYKNQTGKLWLFWVLIAPLPASLTTGVPNANIGRALMVFPGLEFICALGLITLLAKIKKWKFLSIFLIGLIISGSLIVFLQHYFFTDNTKYAFFWGKPFQEAATFIDMASQTNKHVIVSDPYHQSYMYYLFYAKKEPRWLFQQHLQRDATVGYSRINNIEFRNIEYGKDTKLSQTLLIGTPEEIPDTANITNRIYYQKKEFLRVTKTE